MGLLKRSGPKKDFENIVFQNRTSEMQCPGMGLCKRTVSQIGTLQTWYGETRFFEPICPKMEFHKRSITEWNCYEFMGPKKNLWSVPNFEEKNQNFSHTFLRVPNPITRNSLMQPFDRIWRAFPTMRFISLGFPIKPTIKGQWSKPRFVTIFNLPKIIAIDN